MPRQPRSIVIKRAAFETAGWRIIELARGTIRWPDNSTSGFNVRLRADFGEEGDVHLVIEDTARANSTKAIRLRRIRL